MNKISEIGCIHYKRKARFITPCCQEIYTCRFCHDENESHKVDRHAIKHLICSQCATVQRVHTTCLGCGIRFGKYTCLICNLFDDEEKGQFHCTGCGLCRIGGEENYFHCDRCNMCLNINIMTSHKCVEDAAKGNCPICLDDDMLASRQELHLPKCGHCLHMKCWEKLKTAGFTLCPICKAIMT